MSLRRDSLHAPKMCGRHGEGVEQVCDALRTASRSELLRVARPLLPARRRLPKASSLHTADLTESVAEASSCHTDAAESWELIERPSEPCAEQTMQPTSRGSLRRQEPAEDQEGCRSGVASGAGSAAGSEKAPALEQAWMSCWPQAAASSPPYRRKKFRGEARCRRPGVPRMPPQRRPQIVGCGLLLRARRASLQDCRIGCALYNLRVRLTGAVAVLFLGAAAVAWLCCLDGF
eukprot:TRINITY_DN30486_c1_g1_i2.p1 TRINITY_DN30486_c1_g1~~TRINITY_DN30486_c1_g1_i2.p1  ORF type:complete len:233 (+),score=48.55 TRINITY_DN30486_c1_g1_i2:643-1341(+)